MRIIAETQKLSKNDDSSPHVNKTEYNLLTVIKYLQPCKALRRHNHMLCLMGRILHSQNVHATLISLVSRHSVEVLKGQLMNKTKHCKSNTLDP